MNFDDWGLHPVKCRQSAASTALRCERKWFLQYRAGVRLRGGYLKEAATLGTIYHRFQLEGPGQEAEEKVRSWLREKQAAIVERIEAGDDIDGTLARKANKLTELFDIAKVMSNIFWEKFPMPDWFVEIAKEVHVEMPLPEPWSDVILSGTIDRLLLDTKTGFVWVRDHKSTGQSLDSIFAAAGWSLQSRIYRLLAEHWLRSQSVIKLLLNYTQSQRDHALAINQLAKCTVQGFILDGIERPGIKLCRTDEKNAKEWNCSVSEAYLRRVKDWYREYEGKEDRCVMRSKAALYAEGRYPRELKTAFNKIAGLARRTQDPNDYDRDVTRSECFCYQRACPYIDLCNTDPKQWDSLFERKYKRVSADEAEFDE